jgi:hypothetical protein
MRFIRPSILVMAWIAAGCGTDTSPGAAAPGVGGAAGAPAGPGAGGTGGASSSPGEAGGQGTGGSGGPSETSDAGNITSADARSGVPADANGGATEDASPGAGGDTDGGAANVDSNTPMSVDGAPPPSYEGQIPIHYGRPVGPIVQMDCPGDPTEGWTEYQDSFNVQRPYNLPINTRFSITGGIYNFWVFPNDFPHSPDAGGRNPRTEARYGGTADKATGNNFQAGMRMYSADMFIERNAVGSAIMQIHATDPAVPIGVRVMPSGDMVNNGTLTVVRGSTVPGGLIDSWFNYKASLDTATMEVKIYVNNCLKSTYTGQRGSGAFYFKNGVYFCKTSQNGCFTHYKNIHLYKK